MYNSNVMFVVTCMYICYICWYICCMQSLPPTPPHHYRRHQPICPSQTTPSIPPTQPCEASQSHPTLHDALSLLPTSLSPTLTNHSHPRYPVSPIHNTPSIPPTPSLLHTMPYHSCPCCPITPAHAAMSLLPTPPHQSRPINLAQNTPSFQATLPNHSRPSCPVSRHISHAHAATSLSPMPPMSPAILWEYFHWHIVNENHGEARQSKMHSQSISAFCQAMSYTRGLPVT